jgi:hypothetical protein
MNRRQFLWVGSTLVSTWGVQARPRLGAFCAGMLATEGDGGEANPNWAGPELGAKARASSQILNPPSYGLGLTSNLRFRVSSGNSYEWLGDAV